MPTETLPTNGCITTEPQRPAVSAEDALRERAMQRLADVRRFKFALSVYVLSLFVLVPVWVVTQYFEQDGWPKHLSSRSRYPGDWDPWILWVAAVGAVIVGLHAYRAYVRREPTEAEIDREMRRLTAPH